MNALKAARQENQVFLLVIASTKTMEMSTKLYLHMNIVQRCSHVSVHTVRCQSTLQ